MSKYFVTSCGGECLSDTLVLGCKMPRYDGNLLVGVNACLGRDLGLCLGMKL